MMDAIASHHGAAAELARALGVSRASVHRWVKGVSRPPAWVCWAIESYAKKYRPEWLVNAVSVSISKRVSVEEFRRPIFDLCDGLDCSPGE